MQVGLRVLALVSEERNGYGLRSNDYSRYHAHCSNKTQRLRQKLNLTHGKGREYKRTQPVTTENLSDNHLRLSLFEAERAWTHSHEIAASPAYAEDGALRHRATGRFRRAVGHSNTLLGQAKSLVASGRLGTGDLLEVIAYHLILEGRFYLRRDEFQPAIERLCVARVILVEILTQGATTSRDQALYTIFSDEIAPQIRSAAHSVGRKHSYDIDAAVRDIATPAVRAKLVEGYATLASRLDVERSAAAKKAGAAGGSTLGMLRELVWEGQPVPMRNPELVDAFLLVQDAEDALHKGKLISVGKKRIKKDDVKGLSEPAMQSTRGKIQAFDSVLLALTDAESVARKILESKEVSTPLQDAAGGRDIHFIHAYTTYRLLSRRIERDRLLINSLVEPAQSAVNKVIPVTPASKGKAKETSVDPRVNPGLVKLYDTILQSLEQMRSLSIVDESIDLVPSVESRQAYSRAQRTLYLSRTYGTLMRYAEALALTGKAHIYLREASSILSSSDSTNPKAEEKYYPLTVENLAEAEKILSAEQLKMKTDWYSYNGGQATSAAVKSEHKKPTFYDVAFNYIELPMDRLHARANPAAVSKPPATKAINTAPAGSKLTAAQQTTDVRKEKRLAKVEEDTPVVPEINIVQSGGLSSILGGWWGRR